MISPPPPQNKIGIAWSQRGAEFLGERVYWKLNESLRYDIREAFNTALQEVRSTGIESKTTWTAQYALVSSEAQMARIVKANSTGALLTI
jgi:hypothetical protein